MHQPRGDGECGRVEYHLCRFTPLDRFDGGCGGFRIGRVRGRGFRQVQGGLGKAQVEADEAAQVSYRGREGRGECPPGLGRVGFAEGGVVEEVQFVVGGCWGGGEARGG